MSEGTPKAIEIKGIVRNATKIGVQDGQAEDLINLRFMDGSWRASGDGRLVHTMSGTQYTQLYVHTNVYHHLLGVYQGTLYWFASIASDGVTFYPLDSTTDRTNWPTDFQELPTAPVALTTVHGDLWITQTGHLLTIIDGEDDFEYFVFHINSNVYVNVSEIRKNTPSDSTQLSPYGGVRFGVGGSFSSVTEKLETDPTWSNLWSNNKDINKDNLLEQIPVSTADDLLTAAIGKAIKKNNFVHPFLACVAVELYDGSYVLASNPVLLVPNNAEYYSDGGNGYTKNGFVIDKSTIGSTPWYHIIKNWNGGFSGGAFSGHHVNTQSALSYYDSSYCSLATYKGHESGSGAQTRHEGTTLEAGVISSSLGIQIERNFFGGNADMVFSGIGVFVSEPIPLYYVGDKENLGDYKANVGYADHDTNPEYLDSGEYIATANIAYVPKRRQENDILESIRRAQFFLLKRYGKEVDITQISTVNLSSDLDAGLLENIASQKLLPIEAFGRITYIPKVSYSYNNRLHIANYKAIPFNGYPLKQYFSGSFLNGNSTYRYENFKIGDNYARVLPAYLAENYSGAILSYLRVFIKTPYGEHQVVKYVSIPSTPADSNGNWLLSEAYLSALNPLLAYPDSRAYKMELYVVRIFNDASALTTGTQIKAYRREFTLTPFQNIGISAYVNPKLRPLFINDSSFILSYPSETTLTFDSSQQIAQYGSTFGINETGWKELSDLGEALIIKEYYPNGLKVSKTDNPYYFPVENTYQVGSAEIIALCSNAIAVGTGQTGAAPLYVFCKDGVYALFVDASGQMTYSNSRVLARDVCNNPRSVTPIDAGVVFTTDRGLMMIAGEQVQEIGAPAEGDVVQFWNAGSVDYSKIATASMQQIASLPSALCSTTDFLTYLQDKGTSGKAAIINYNHNMRELMVSNPNYPYSYVLDREGNWSRRDYTAAQYVNNYPTSYRVDADGHFYKVDDEGNANTSLEHRKEADNKIFYLSNVIKLDSIGFKQAYRFVVRGYFETTKPPLVHVQGNTASDAGDYTTWPFVSLDPNQTNLTFVLEGQHAVNLVIAAKGYYDNAPDESPYDPGWDDAYFRLEPNTPYTLSQCIRDMLFQTETRISGINEIDIQVETLNQGEGGKPVQVKVYNNYTGEAYVGIVVEGSYDGIKFAPLGFNRKSGKFRDIGCLVSHTDMRFFRICLSGQVTGKTRIDYMEMSAGASMLNTKIR